MLKVFVALACLACASHGRRKVLAEVDEPQFHSQALAMLLLARNPASAFNLRAPLTAGTRTLAGSGGHRLPMMSAGDEAALTSPGVSRRKAAAALLGLGLAALAGPSASNAAERIVSGRVNLPKGEAGVKEEGALYVTARPPAGLKDGIAAARGQGSGQAPPIALARYPAPLKFPFEFELKDPADLTPEGAADVTKETWGDKDLTVVVRYDTDGVAATRGANDLTGQSEVKRVDGKLGNAEVELAGRGFVSVFMQK
mmetsp:Transcript_142603/g.251682  ORF Transcript_142603/g.251682 Transcript_142603/m.251682 type:complete len:256 (+) Transcript_142603:56-823(+)